MTIRPTGPALAQDRPSVISRKPVPFLTEQQRAGLRPELLAVIENRKSG